MKTIELLAKEEVQKREIRAEELRAQMREKCIDCERLSQCLIVGRKQERVTRLEEEIKTWKEIAELVKNIYEDEE